MTEDALGGMIKGATDAITEVAKAEQAQQKTAQELIAAARAAGEYMGPHFRSAISEFGAMLGDQMTYWRFRNFNRLLLKIEALSGQARVHPEAIRQLSYADSIRLIEASSAEDEETVQDLWARLIANAIDVDSKTTIKKVYIDLLKSVAPAEAALLDLLWSGESPPRTIRTSLEARAFNESMNKLAEERWRRFDEEGRKVATQNLVRLRCVTLRPGRINLSGMLKPIEDRQFGTAGFCLVDAGKFEALLRHLTSTLEVSAGLADPQMRPQSQFAASPIPEMSLALTPLGHGLMNACRLRKEAASHAPEENKPARTD
jgi:hypothetical protein